MLVLGRNLVKNERRSIGHSELETVARSKDMTSPMSLEDIEDSWTKTKSALCHPNDQQEGADGDGQCFLLTERTLKIDLCV